MITPSSLDSQVCVVLTVAKDGAKMEVVATLVQTHGAPPMVALPDGGAAAGDGMEEQLQEMQIYEDVE